MVPVSKVLTLSLLWALFISLLISVNFVVFGEPVSLEVGNIDSNMSILLFFKEHDPWRGRFNMGLNQGFAALSKVICSACMMRLFVGCEHFWNSSVCTSLCIFVGLNERLM